MSAHIDDKLQRIASRLDQLKRLDPDLTVFGAGKHRYCLNPVLGQSKVSAFEKKHNIVLPEGYRRFILELGDGGAGPYYGLEKFEHGLHANLDRRRGGPLDPSQPFPHAAAWNLPFPQDMDDEAALEVFSAEYYDDKWVGGVLRICNYGCGVYFNIVVNGPESGNVWVDDRGNDAGIYPDPYFEQSGKTEFLDWYLLWLDSSSKELEA